MPGIDTVLRGMRTQVTVDNNRLSYCILRSPLRMCAATREILPTGMMIRFVVAKDENDKLWVVPDMKGRRFGRGVWIWANRVAMERVFSQPRRVEVAFRPAVPHMTSVITPQVDIINRVQGLLKSSCRESLVNLNKKGGLFSAENADGLCTEIDKRVQMGARRIMCGWIDKEGKGVTEDQVEMLRRKCRERQIDCLTNRVLSPKLVESVMGQQASVLGLDHCKGTAWLLMDLFRLNGLMQEE